MLPLAEAKHLATLDVINAIGSSLYDAVTQDEPFVNVTTDTGIVAGLPSYQWQLDVARMEAYVRARMQTLVAMHASGYPNHKDYISLPTTKAQKEVCRSHKVVKQGGFANISVFGLAFTLSMSGLLLILDFGILRFFLWLERLGRPHKVRYWIQDGMYQLQRTAYEALDANAATWTRREKELPRTVDDLPDLASLGVEFTRQTMAIAPLKSSAVSTTSIQCVAEKATCGDGSDANAQAHSFRLLTKAFTS